jgi:redox-sensitive bicupin YhaK (pirin superfamily)
MLQGGRSLDHQLLAGDSAYLVLASGTATVNGNRFRALEALVVRDESTLHIEALENSEIVLIVTA